MITEDYVSFEVAKLLKEKGFDERGFCVYTVGSKELVVFGDWVENSCLLPHLIAAPIHQMALKWLREIHHIDICVCRELDEQGKCFDGYIAVVCKDDTYKVTIRAATKNLTFEEATNKAIKYGLTLIQ